MEALYNVDPSNREYLLGQDTEAKLNRKYTPATHDIADKYQYNRLTSSLIKPPDVGENEKQILIDNQWIVVPDFRGKDFYDTTTQEKYQITSLDEKPEPSWTNQEPTYSYQVWDGNTWIDDFDRWLNQIVRPLRDGKMAAFEWRLGRHERDIRLGLTPTDDIVLLDEYMQALADLPAALSAVADPIPWPELP